MSPALRDAAAQLGNDEIHVWQLHYQKEQGRAPLLAVLAAYLGIPADNVLLATGAHGRPALASTHGQSFDFNWSHSGDAALIAIARGIAPGVDLERVRSRPRALEIAQRYFSRDESAALADIPATERDAAFLALWTAKEAVLKALGRGIAFGLDRLSISNSRTGALALLHLQGEDLHAWQLQRLALDEGWLGALAWRGGKRRIRLFVLADND